MDNFFHLLQIQRNTFFCFVLNSISFLLKSPLNKCRKSFFGRKIYLYQKVEFAFCKWLNSTLKYFLPICSCLSSFNWCSLRSKQKYFLEFVLFNSNCIVFIVSYQDVSYKKWIENVLLHIYNGENLSIKFVGEKSLVLGKLYS